MDAFIESRRMPLIDGYEFHMIHIEMASTV